MKRILVTLCLIAVFLVGVSAFQKEETKQQKEERVIGSLVLTILEEVNDEVVHGCESIKSHPRYFPQFPKIVISKEGADFSSGFWAELRFSAKSEAPSVTLLKTTEATEDSYLIHILSISGVDTPLATVNYQHSAFTFGIGKGGFKNYFLLGEAKRSESAKTISTNRALVPTGGWYSHSVTMSLQKDNIHFEEGFSEKKDETDSIVIAEVTKAIIAFESSTKELKAQRTPFHTDQIKVEVTEISDGVYYANAAYKLSPGVTAYVGSWRGYLVVKQQSSWRVAESESFYFSDMMPGMMIGCR
jgi:hypothetical protein